MQNIQWFPGHMTKAFRMMEENIKLCDGVFFIIDARCPISCINKKLLKIFENKPVLYILNKSDLVEKSDLIKSIKFFKENYGKAIGITGSDKRAVKDILREGEILLKEKIDRNLAKGLIRPMRFMVAGIPNTGKSTIINTLSGEKKAITGNKAGVTKGKQWIKLQNLELLDTPGTTPPSFANQIQAKHLAYVGSLNDDILDISTLALEMIEEFSKNCPEKLKEKYKLTNLDKPPLEIYEDICKNRGFILKGNDFDYERCGTAIIDDFRKGRIGKICLDNISNIENIDEN